MFRHFPRENLRNPDPDGDIFFVPHIWGFYNENYEERFSTLLEVYLNMADFVIAQARQGLEQRKGKYTQHQFSVEIQIYHPGEDPEYPEYLGGMSFTMEADSNAALDFFDQFAPAPFFGPGVQEYYRTFPDALFASLQKTPDHGIVKGRYQPDWRPTQQQMTFSSKLGEISDDEDQLEAGLTEAGFAKSCYQDMIYDYIVPPTLEFRGA